MQKASKCIVSFVLTLAMFGFIGCSSIFMPDSKVGNKTQIKMKPPLSDRPLLTAELLERIDGATATTSLLRGIWCEFEQVDPEKYQPSGTHLAYQRLMRGEVDLIFVTAPATQIKYEAELAKINLVLTPVAADALVFITSINNTASHITQQDIRKIYCEEIEYSWPDLGGPVRKIIPIAKNEDSGSQYFMENIVLIGQPIGAKVLENHNDLKIDGMLQQVAFYNVGSQDKSTAEHYALGYTLYTYLQQMGQITGIDKQLKMLVFEGIAPTDKNISSGEYPLTDGYYAVYREDLAEDHPLCQLVEWLRTPAGEKLLRDYNFIPRHTEPRRVDLADIFKVG